MGVYLNSTAAYTLYSSEAAKPYFIDKTGMLQELFELVEEGGHYICITRPRRFGKTVAANMISTFFTKGCDAAGLFDRLDIAKKEGYQKYRNQYALIHISFNELPKRCQTYEQYISRIEERLARDLVREYPEVPVQEEDAVWDILTDIYTADPSARFIFVLDEWDFIFHRDFVTNADKAMYVMFLSNLLKDKPYVRLAYMTGILPVAKYSSGSGLNMFLEYGMVTEGCYSMYFGFCDEEVDRIYQRYLERTAQPAVTREGLREWYDGYCTFSGRRIYNPRSVIGALGNNNLGNYWTSSGPYDEIFYYIEKNVAEVREDLAIMVSGGSVAAQIREYAATSMNLKTKDEIFSAMVVYGFLSYWNGKVSIPNKELMGKFMDMLKKEPSLGYVHRLAKESGRMLQATLCGDTETMVEILEYAHNTETPLLEYNHETDLAALVNLIYLSARDIYRMEREDKAGTGYADFIFYPKTDLAADCIILELKIGRSPQEAVRAGQREKICVVLCGKAGGKSVLYRESVCGRH